MGDAPEDAIVVLHGWFLPGPMVNSLRTRCHAGGGPWGIRTMYYYPRIPTTLEAFDRLAATMQAVAGIATRPDATVILSGAPVRLRAHASYAWA